MTHDPTLLIVAQLALLPLATALAARVLRRSPAHAHAVIVAGIIATIVAPGLTLLFAARGVGLLPSMTVAVAEIATKSVAADDDTARNASLLTPWRLAMVAWAACTLVLTTRTVVGFARGLRVAAGARRIDDARVRAALRLVAGSRADRVDVRRCDEVEAPAISCWSRRPRILLPGGLADAPNAVVLVPFLRHELAHLERRDHWWRLLAEIAVCLVPWHPALWWLRRQIYRTSELACDARVVRADAPDVYAESLLRLVPCRASRVPALSGLRTPGSLAERIEAILDTRPRRDRTGVPALLAIALAATVVVSGAALAQRRPPVLAGVQFVDHAAVRPIPDLVEMGVVNAGETAHGVVRLANVGPVPVRLLRSKAACGCTTIEPLAAQTIAPGGVIAVDVSLDAPDTAGTERIRKITFFFEAIDPVVVNIRLMTAEG